MIKVGSVREWKTYIKIKHFKLVFTISTFTVICFM